MNVAEIIKYGHRDVLESIKDLKDSLQDKPGVTTHWSIKDTLAHLASYEHLLEDALSFVAKSGNPSPFLDAMSKSSSSFNDQQVAKYKPMSYEEVVVDYTKTYERVEKLVKELGPDKLHEVGTIPWYGETYSLDDFIVYASYGHKREHIGQIKQFRKK